LLEADDRRGMAGGVAVGGTGAGVGLPRPSGGVAGARRLRRLTTGGRAPLGAGLLRAAEVLRAERLRDPARRPLLVLVTDGRATDGDAADRAARLLTGTACVVVDCETGPLRLGLAARLAARLRATLLPLDALSEPGAAVPARRAHAKAV